MEGSSTVSQKSARALLGASRGSSGGVFRPNLENNDKIVIIFAKAFGHIFARRRKTPLDVRSRWGRGRNRADKMNSNAVMIKWVKSIYHFLAPE